VSSQPLPICRRTRVSHASCGQTRKHYERQQVRGFRSLPTAPPMLSHSCTVVSSLAALPYQLPSRRQPSCNFSATFLSYFLRRSFSATQQRSAIPVALGHSSEAIWTFFTFCELFDYFSEGGFFLQAWNFRTNHSRMTRPFDLHQDTLSARYFLFLPIYTPIRVLYLKSTSKMFSLFLHSPVAIPDSQGGTVNSRTFNLASCQSPELVCVSANLYEVA
jgi:hypothetical protein